MYLSNVDVLLALVLNKHRDRKELKKLVLKLMKKASPTTVNGILSRVIDSRCHRREIELALQQFDEMRVFIKELSTAGHHGMIIIGSRILPLDLVVEEAEDWEWARANERLIQIAGAHQAMNNLNLNRLECNVVLFGTAGFSNIPREIAVERQIQNALNVKRIAGTQYTF